MVRRVEHVAGSRIPERQRRAELVRRCDRRPLRTVLAPGEGAAGEMRALRGRLATALGFRRTLARTYACTLVEIEGPDAPEAETCPEAAEQADG